MSTEEIVRTKVQDDDVPILTVRQQREVLRLPDRRRRLGRRDASMLAILIGGGLRIGELVRLRTQDVERGPSGALLLTVKTSKRRDGHRRCVALLPPFVRPVQGYQVSARPGFWLFEGRRGEHLSVRAGQDAILKHLRRVRPDLRVHDLRHTTITNLLRASGGDVWLAVNLAGHSDSRQIIRVYGHHLIRDAVRAAEYVAAALNRKKEAS